MDDLTGLGVTDLLPMLQRRQVSPADVGPVPCLDRAEPTYSELLDRAGPSPLDELARVAGARDALRAAFLRTFHDNHVLLMPVASLPAFEVGAGDFEIDGVRVPYWQVLACCRAISLFGVPSAVVRCGQSREGLPVGVQVVGPPYAEALVLRVAAQLEERLSGAAGWPRPPASQARSNSS